MIPFFYALKFIKQARQGTVVRTKKYGFFLDLLQLTSADKANDKHTKAYALTS